MLCYVSRFLGLRWSAWLNFTKTFWFLCICLKATNSISNFYSRSKTNVLFFSLNYFFYEVPSCAYYLIKVYQQLFSERTIALPVGQTMTDISIPLRNWNLKMWKTGQVHPSHGPLTNAICFGNLCKPSNFILETHPFTNFHLCPGLKGIWLACVTEMNRVNPCSQIQNHSLRSYMV